MKLNNELSDLYVYAKGSSVCAYGHTIISIRIRPFYFRFRAILNSHGPVVL